MKKRLLQGRPRGNQCGRGCATRIGTRRCKRPAGAGPASTTPKAIDGDVKEGQLLKASPDRR